MNLLMRTLDGSWHGSCSEAAKANSNVIARMTKGSSMGALINEANSTRLHDRSLKIIAKSLFRELKENGYDNRQIVNLSTELLSLVTTELRDTNQGVTAS